MHIAFVLPDLKGGGAQKMIINLANEFAAQGNHVDLVLFNQDGIYKNRIHDKVHIRDFKKHRSLLAAGPLSRYIHTYKPDVMVSALFHVNLVTIIARAMSKHKKSKVIVTERNHLSLRLSDMSFVQALFFKLMVRFLYPMADKVVGISDGVCDDLRKIIKPEDKKFVETIYNPVVTEDFDRLITHDLPSIFPKDTSLKLITSGRLVKQKDYPTLLKALSLYKQENEAAHLVVLGEGPLKQEIVDLSKKLGVNDNVSFLGFVDNPLACMKQADAFVMSSAWEGFCNVIVEALYCGLPVVSTDCPSGPSEILEKGKYGQLVDVGDAEGFSKALGNISNDNKQERQDRSMDFTVNHIAKKFKKVFRDVLKDEE